MGMLLKSGLKLSKSSVVPGCVVRGSSFPTDLQHNCSHGAESLEPPKIRWFITSEHPCLWSHCTPFSAQPFPLLWVFWMPAVPVSEGHHLTEKCNFSIILRPLPTYRWAQVAHWTQELQGLASSPSPGWVPLMLRLSRSGNTFLDSLPLKQTPAQLSCCTPAAPGQSHPTGDCETSLTRLINATHPTGSAGIPWWINPGH